MWYGWLVLRYYSSYLNAELIYVPRGATAAREDVLGFGFLLTWILFFFAWSLFELLAYTITKSKIKHLLFSATAFFLVSLIDFVFFGVLEHQVPK